MAKFADTLAALRPTNIDEAYSNIEGDHIFESGGIFNGHIYGSAVVLSGVRLDLQGKVDGALYIDPGATVEIHGTVGRVVNFDDHIKACGDARQTQDAGCILIQ